MGKSHHHKSENKFKFQTFSERIANVDIDVIHRIVHHDDTPEENLTYFGEAIEKWTELNCTQHFAEFRKEISSQVQTFTQLVHHKDDIVDGLARHLQIPDSMALDALLDLTVQLSRDLQKDFVVYFPKFFQLLVGLLNGQNAELLEQVFTALAYLFKYLWRYLVKDIYNVYEFFSELLSENHKKYIRNFAAESFAFLMRKAKNPSELFDFMFQALEEHPDKVEGTGRLLFEMIKGVKGQLHSCVESVLPLVLSKLGPSGKTIKKSKLPLDLVSRSISHLFTCVTQYIGKERVTVVWNILLSNLNTVYEACNSASEKKMNVTAQHLSRIVVLTNQIVQFRSGFFVTEPDMIAKVLIEILTGNQLGQEADTKVIDLVTSLLLMSHASLSVEYSVKLVSLVMKKEVSCDVIYKFVHSLLDLPLFEKDVLPALIVYTDTVISNGQHQEETLQLLTDIILNKATLPHDGSDIDGCSEYIIDYGKNRKSVVEYITSLLTDKENGKDVSKLWSALVCIPHIRPLSNKDGVVEVIQKILHNLCDTSVIMTDDVSFLVYQLFVCCLKLQSVDEMLTWISVDMIKTLVRKQNDNILVLRAVDLYFTHAANSSRSEVLTEDRLLEMYSFLQNNLSSPQSQIRKLSLRILSHFDIRLPSVDDQNDQIGVFRVCLEAENTPLSVQSYREKQMFLQKLEFTAVQHQIPIGPFTQVPLKYLLGCLFINFKFLWEPLQKLIATHAQGLNKEDFWRIFLSQLQNFSSTGSSSEGSNADTIVSIKSFSKQKSTLCTNEVVDHNNFRIQMWRTMQLFPQLCESKSRDLVPLFLQFLEEEYYSVDNVFAKSQNLLKDVTSEDDKMEDDTEEKVQAENEKKKGKTSRKHVTGTLLSQLQLFSLFTNPKSMYKEAELRDIYMELLRHKNGEIQKVVFKCILTYKPPYLVPYRENFERLIDDKTFKNEIVTFSLDEETSMIKVEHREYLLPVLMRILYGKMLSKTGKDTSGKAKSNYRRAMVFRFIVGCQQKEICIFLDMIFSSFHSYTQEDPLTLVQNIVNKLDLSVVTPVRKMAGGIQSIDLIISKLGHRIESYLHSLLKILLGISCTAVCCLEHREEISSGLLSPLKNVRQMCIERMTQFFEEFTNYKFTEREMDAVFTVAVWPQLAKLTYEGLYHPTPLMKLFNVWSLHSRYFLLLTKARADDMTLYPMNYLFKLLNVKDASVAAKHFIVQIVYQLLTSEDETPPLTVSNSSFHDNLQDGKDLNLGMKLLVPHVPAILEHIQKTVIGVKLKDKQVTRELEILSRLSEFVTDKSQCSTLVTLLLPFLADKVSRSQSVENDILKSIKNLLRIVDDKHTFYKSICSLCGHVQSCQGRSLVCSTLEVVSAGEENLEKISSIVTELNAWDPKRIEEPDYLRRLAGFRETNSIIKSMTTLDIQFLHAVLVNSCFFIKMVDDLSLRDNATNCLVTMVTQFSHVEFDQDVYREIISQGLLPEIKKGIKNKDETIRHEFILLLSKLVEVFPMNAMFTDLCLLRDKDVEADFFENIRHIQTHRKSRALRRMIKQVQSHPMKKEIIVSYLLPITESFLNDEKYAKAQNVLDVAVESLGFLCKLLPWRPYSFLLKFYLTQMQKRLDKNKHYVKIIVVILDAFHFDLRNSEYAEKGVPKAAEENIDENEEENRTVEISQEVDEAPNTTSDKEVCSSTLATRIHLSISHMFIPKLQKYLTEKIKSDEEHKMAATQSAYPEDSEILRVPLALAMVKLLQNLPQKTLEQNLPGILLKVCNFLKSRAKDIRVTSRDTLVRIVMSLGPRYFPYVLSELRGTLRRGYQLHVLGFTLHTILRNMSATIKPGDLDFCRDSLQQIFHEELFGMVSEEKDVDAIKGKVFEAKTMKSYDSYQILAKFIGMGSLSALLQPLKEVLNSTQSLKFTKKIQEALRNISYGLIDNTGIDIEKTMIFVHSLITSQDEQKSEQKPEEKKGFRPPSCLLLPTKPEYGGGKPKANKKTNTHVLVEFGLEILYLLLKRSKLTHQDPEHLQLIDPFILIINDNLQSKYIKVNIMCLRCLGWLLKFPLPSLMSKINKIAQGLFVLLKNYASVGAAKGDNFELVSLLFKTVTVLVRDVKYHKINEDQLHVLLSFCEEDLYDHNRQSTAFSLFRAILSRKLNNEEIQEVVKKIREMSITADSAHIRRECRQIMSQYLMDYPLGKTLISHLEYFVTQLSYKIDTGRESALEMLATIFSTFPQKILVKNSGLFFIPMSAALMNDTSSKCRMLTALAIKSLLQQVDDRTRNDLFQLCVKWLSEEKITLKTLGAQTCGLFVEVETTKFTSRLTTILPLIQRELQEYDTEKEGNEDIDHLLYNFLSLLTKICKECNIIRDSQYTELLNATWGHVKSLLLYPHNWVRTSASQLFGLLFAAWNPEDILKTQKNRPEYLQIDTVHKLEELSGYFVSQLQSHYLNTELADQVIKNMVFITKVTKHIPDSGDHRLSLPWLLRKMVREANHEVVSNSASTSKRSSVFKWIAAVSIDLGADLLGSVLHIFLPSIQRETLDSSPNTDPELKRLAQEVMDMVKQIVGVDKFTTVYAEVLKKRLVTKETRKRQHAVTAVTHPEIAARRKLKKNLNKKEAKKRKLEDFRVSKKIKRKKTQSF